MQRLARIAAIVTVLISGNAFTGGLRLLFGQPRTPDVVYVGTPYDVVSTMLKMARVRKQDTVYDLGCGDGRILIMAARKYGSQGFGYDIDAERVSVSKASVKKNHVENLVKIFEADLFALDLRDADVISMYLLPDINRRLLPQLEKLKPGVRLVFHDYGLDGIKEDEKIEAISNEDNARHILYLYTTPLKRKKN